MDEKNIDNIKKYKKLDKIKDYVIERAPEIATASVVTFLAYYSVRNHRRAVNLHNAFVGASLLNEEYVYTPGIGLHVFAKMTADQVAGDGT